MNTILSSYNWNNIRICDIFQVSSGKAGTKYTYGGNTYIFQIDLKLSGYTEIFYNNERIEHRANTILYLPKESTPDVDFHQTVITEGETACLFFNTTEVLPPHPVFITPENDAMKDLFLKLLKAYNRPAKNPFACMSLFYDILSKFHSALSLQNISDTDTMPDAVRYMSEHVADRYIDFNILADMYGISIDYFRHRFKKAYGLSPLQYYNTIKINYIKSLIHQNRYSFTAISKLSGFSNLNYFSRYFKKQTGVSPGEYRKSHLT